MPATDFSSISPSARSLLLTKAFTTIPFARDAAILIWGENVLQKAKQKFSSAGAIMRLLHFEGRYLSIDAALAKVALKNILEFSSGFSFRGLALCSDPEVIYFDTDLPGVIETKQQIIQELTKIHDLNASGNYHLESLNIFDSASFHAIVGQFPAGSLAIVNEGLLVYLKEDQKRELCSIIREILLERGGYWVTSDIYVQTGSPETAIEDFYNDRGREFLAEHEVEQNKFESFEAAGEFFDEVGFTVFEKVEPKVQLSALKLLEKAPGFDETALRNRKKNRETWILAVKEE
jgi:O-methyltransferase involved in polyketide biosynthesis